MSVAAVTNRRSRPAPRLAALLLAGALAAVAVLFGGGVASAHAYLRGSDPADGSTVQRLPAAVSLDFNETIHNFEPVVVVTGPDGKNHATGVIQVVGNVVSTAVSTDGPPGSYAVAYRVVSADGHPVAGELHFTVTAPAAGSSAPSSSSPAATSGRASSSAPGSPSTRSSPPRSSTAGSSTVGSSTAGSSTAGSSTVGSATAGGSTTGSASNGSAAGSSSSADSTPAAPSDPGSSTPVDQSAGSSATSSGPDWWIWLAIAVAGVILIVAGVITLRRPHED